MSTSLVSGGGGGGGSSGGCVSDTQEWGDFLDTSNITAEFCATSNRMEVSIDVSGTTSAFLDEGNAVARASIDIKRERLEGIASEAKSIIRRGIRDQFDIPSPSMLPGGASSFGTLDITVDDAPEPPVRIGEYSSSVSKSIRYSRPTARIPQQVSDKLPETIGVDITISAVGFDKWIRRVSPVTINLEIPLDYLMDIQIISKDICSLQFPDLEEAAKTIEETVRDREGDFDNVRTRLEDAREQLNGFNGVPSAEQFSGGESQRDRVLSRVQDTVNEWNRMEPEIGQDLRDAVRTWDTKIDNVGGECLDMFRSMAEPHIDRAREMANNYSSVNTMASRAESLPGIDELDGSRAGDVADDVQDALEEIPGRIRTRLSNFQAAVEEFANTNFNRRSRERRDNLINEGEELISDIRQLEAGRPGRAEALGQARASVSRLRRLNAPSTGQVPCGDLHPGVESAMENLEGYVENLDRDVTEEDLNTVEDLEESVISRIQAIDDSKCEGRYARRLRKENRRVDVLTSPIRVREEVMNESRDRRQELIQQLISN